MILIRDIFAQLADEEHVSPVDLLARVTAGPPHNGQAAGELSGIRQPVLGRGR